MCIQDSLFCDRFRASDRNNGFRGLHIKAGIAGVRHASNIQILLLKGNTQGTLPEVAIQSVIL